MIAVALLGVLALGGLGGGLALVTDPTGGRLGMTVERLPGWLPFADYLIPGVALIVLFGVLPAIVAMLLVRHSPRAWTATAALGVLLVFWSGAQIAALGLVFLAAQIGFLIVGVVLVGLGVDGGASDPDEFVAAQGSYAHAEDDER
jgi:hypothetical protein